MERLELSRNFSPDSKSGASTNYATSAIIRIIIYNYQKKENKKLWIKKIPIIF